MLTALVVRLATVVVAAVVPAAVTLGVRYLNRRWNLQLSELEMQRMTAFAQEAVTAADQKFKHAPPGPDTNRQKFEFALRQLTANHERAGLSVDPQVAEQKIEAALGVKRSQEQERALQGTLPSVTRP
jgi:hypothetical protein